MGWRDGSEGLKHLPDKGKDLSSNPRTHIKPGGSTHVYNSLLGWEAETGESPGACGPPDVHGSKQQRACFKQVRLGSEDQHLMLPSDLMCVL